MLNVIFPRGGFYHPAYGRLGINDMAGAVYSLPEEFAQDGMLPTGTEIIEDPEDLREVLEENEQPAPIKPKPASDAKQTLPQGAGQAKKRKVVSGVEKVTGGAPRKAKPKRSATKAKA